MIETKYLILIGVVICLLILYYFYDDISKIKKSFVPVYQKTMELEAKILQIETQCKKKVMKQEQKTKKKRNDSPVFSVSYQSDVLNKSETTNIPESELRKLSIKYSEISETEGNNLLKNINRDKTIYLKESSPKAINSKLTTLKITASPDKLTASPVKPKINEDTSIVFAQPKSVNILSDFNIPKQDNVSDNSEYFSIKINDIIKPASINANIHDYQEILTGFDAQPSELCSAESDNLSESDDLNHDVVESITNSIKIASLSSAIKPLQHSNMHSSQNPTLSTNVSDIKNEKKI